MEGKKEMKNSRSKKGLSQVVTAIILIAVTIAASIAVTAWMLTSTSSPTREEKLEIGDVEFLDNNQVRIAINNTGTQIVNVTEIRIDSEASWNSTQGVDPDSQVKILVPCTWTNGDVYAIDVVTAKGKHFQKNANSPFQ